MVTENFKEGLRALAHVIMICGLPFVAMAIAIVISDFFEFEPVSSLYFIFGAGLTAAIGLAVQVFMKLLRDL
ncbi:MAG TPA: hypothetical protein VJ201_03495 [Candidatus Babeliales bacterium]|nr:hypothetical protein [Candidatus Babeliales bacterium]